MLRNGLLLQSLLPMLVVLLGACANTTNSGNGANDPNQLPDPEPSLADHQNLHPETGEEALEWLLAGNHRFWDGHPRYDHTSSGRVSELTGGQDPFAVIVGCADSRVSPELIFDHGLGDLFVIRVAGNVVGTDEAGSIEYAVHHLHSPLVVILGHESCGAVTAALGPHAEEPHELVTLLDQMQEGLVDVPKELEAKERVRRGVETNVHVNVERLKEIVGKMHFEGHEPPLIVGAVFDLDSGKVRLVDR